MKEYTLSSIEIERYKNERFAWLYIHAVPPKRDDEDAAANFAVMLRACGVQARRVDGRRN